MAIHIKSKVYRSFDELQTGLLLGYELCELKNDDELYAAIKANGKAIIVPFVYERMQYGEPIVLSPDEFEAS